MATQARVHTKPMPQSSSDTTVSSVPTVQGVKVDETLQEISKALGHVQVTYEDRSGALDVSGETVDAVVESLKDAYGIDPTAIRLVDGKKVDGTYMLRPGQHLEIVKPAGEKGMSCLMSGTHF